MIIDVLIVLVVVGAAWVGFQRGLVQPLLAELFALTTLLIILHNRSAFVATTDALFHLGAVLAVVVALNLAGLVGYLGARLGGSINRMPVVRGVDGFLGVWLVIVILVALQMGYYLRPFMEPLPKHAFYTGERGLFLEGLAALFGR